MKRTILILFVVLSINTTAQSLNDCSNCSTQIVQPKQIIDLGIDEIRFLTNDLFARKGHKFKTSDIDLYYSEKSWYKPVTDNSKIFYNSIEKQNIKLFQDRTLELKTDREKLTNEIKKFKATILANNKAVLMEKFNFLSYDNKEIYSYISATLQRIDVNDINWTKNKGLYKVTVDNGDIVMVYEISINKNMISIQYANQGGSDFGEILYPNDQNTEFNYYWTFEWKNDKLKFIEMIVAG